jgi:hypothetical protein
LIQQGFFGIGASRVENEVSTHCFNGYLHSVSSCIQSSGGWPLSSILRNTR